MPIRHPDGDSDKHAGETYRKEVQCVQLANLNRVFREDLDEKITFKQKLKEVKEQVPRIPGGKAICVEKTVSAQPLGGNMLEGDVFSVAGVEC